MNIVQVQVERAIKYVNTCAYVLQNTIRIIVFFQLHRGLKSSGEKVANFLQSSSWALKISILFVNFLLILIVNINICMLC